ncbi:MAG: hypothetical protein ACREBH_01920 [Candidatus Micrarchaeaceae archaeon]
MNTAMASSRIGKSSCPKKQRVCARIRYSPYPVGTATLGLSDLAGIASVPYGIIIV